MYTIQAEAAFDSAHCLHGYDGKCAHIHGHRWRIVARIQANSLQTQGNERGMVLDFATFKRDLRTEAAALDHTLVLERDTLRPSTLEALAAEGFGTVELPFRPTAENLARYFFNRLRDKGYAVSCIEVYETPTNCASYDGE